MNIILLLSSFIIGLSVGSFLNCLIYRIKEGESFWKGRSYCPGCKHKLGILDLIPVFSFIFLRGKCRYCHQKISWQYPLVELVTAILFAFVYLKSFLFYSQTNSQIFAYQYLFRNWFFISILLFIFIYDLKYYLIPDKIILPAIVITLISDIILSYFSVGSYFSNWLFYSNNPNLSNFLLAATAAGGFFLIQFLISKGRWIGGGDIRLGILMGLMLGWPGILLALFFAYLIGAIIGLGLIAAGKKNWKSQVPFGPFLAGGTIICLLV